jgi:hypothetical protein
MLRHTYLQAAANFSITEHIFSLRLTSPSLLLKHPCGERVEKLFTTFSILPE